MKFIAQISFTIILGFILAQFLPFWSVALAAFGVGIFGFVSPGSSFFAGFLSIAVLWTVSAWIISDMNNDLLLDKVAEIFQLSGILLLGVIALIGGLLGGLSAASGTTLNRLVFAGKAEKNPYKL